MQLNSLTLHHIRSYVDATITFPKGIAMLAGDIGSGKSTVLQAIEFALFGLLRGEVTGNALLRNGTTKGSVELTFCVNDTTHTIKRTLTRAKTTEQDAGYLITNGVKKTATPIELKAAILDILGYPPELLTKSKQFIYRYTVYTPQEDMKRILLDSPEERITILRKLFDIDKYARITTNANTYAKTLRERARAYEASTTDLAEKKKHATNAKKELETTQERISALAPHLELVRTQLKEATTTLATLEAQKQETEKLSREHALAHAQLTASKKQHEERTAELARITQEHRTATQELPAIPDRNALTIKSLALTSQLSQHENTLRALTRKITELETLKNQHETTTHKITTLAHCPTCKQTVTPEHKHSITASAQTHITALSTQTQTHQELLTTTEQTITQLKKEQEHLRTQEQDAATAALKLARITDLHTRKTTVEEHLHTLATDIQKQTTRITEIAPRITPTAELEKTYVLLKTQRQTLTDNERTLSIEHSVLLQKKEHATKTLALFATDIERKERLRSQLEKTTSAHHYLADSFIPLMDVIERHVMTKIHHEFNALFQQWFSMLVEDTMHARLDETFTPLISQNGHDIDVEHLSGGERTACALAYRLALNKTINSLLSSIKTKDLLILDEPTDGFSAEQLDTLRDVLAQLGLAQIIIVSHEQKIEGIADHILRIQKNNHTSTITT